MADQDKSGSQAKLKVIRNVEPAPKRTVNVRNFRYSRDLLMGHGQPLFELGPGAFGVSFAAMDQAAQTAAEPSLADQWRAKLENQTKPFSGA